MPCIQHANSLEARRDGMHCLEAILITSTGRDQCWQALPRAMLEYDAQRRVSSPFGASSCLPECMLANPSMANALPTAAPWASDVFAQNCSLKRASSSPHAKLLLPDVRSCRADLPHSQAVCMLLDSVDILQYATLITYEIVL